MRPNNWRIKKGWMPLRVQEIIDECHDTRTIKLVDAETGKREFDYEAGQYLTFRFDECADKPVVRSYTMSSSPCQQDFVAITVKQTDTAFVSRILCQELKAGDVLRARGAMGKFCYDPLRDGKDLGMIAAGSGVTPFVSIMREYAPRLGTAGAPASMTLLVSYRSTSDLICWRDLVELREYPGVSVHVSLSREVAEGFRHGRINHEMVTDVFSGLSDPIFMSCGPREMMKNAFDALESIGIERERMKTESYDN